MLQLLFNVTDTLSPPPKRRSYVAEMVVDGVKETFETSDQLMHYIKDRQENFIVQAFSSSDVNFCFNLQLFTATLDLESDVSVLVDEFILEGFGDEINTESDSVALKQLRLFKSKLTSRDMVFTNCTLRRVDLVSELINRMESHRKSRIRDL
jgi:hypothetical protein